MRNATHLACLSIVFLFSGMVAAQPTAFTYQGKLTDSTMPANGTYTMVFDLRDAATGGTLIATSGNQNVTVAGGVFTTTLDFGSSAFTGNARWLEVTVNGTTLSPRQPITSEPYAIKASEATNSALLGNVAAANYVLTTDPRLTDARPASSINFGSATLAGVLPIANGGTGSATKNFVDLTTSQTVTGGKTFSSVSNVFTGDGAGLINVDVSREATATTGAAPSVALLTVLALDYPSPTAITNLAGGVNGQCVTLLAMNPNATIADAGNFRLASDWNPFADDTLTVCRSNASATAYWYERARSSNVNYYTLTAATAGTGTGTVTSTPAGINCNIDCTEDYADGTVVTLTATPSSNSTFTGWSGGGCSGTGTCTVTMDAAKSVTATFTLNFRTLTVNRTGTGTGTVTSSPAGINCGADCSEAYVQGTSVTLSVTPSPTSIFNGWFGGGCSGTSTCTVTMANATTVSADFTLMSFTLTAIRTGSGSGTITSSPAGINCGADCTESYTANTMVTLTASPASGSNFTGWSGGGCTGTGTCTVTMTSALSVTATFTMQQFMLTVSRTGSGASTSTVSSSPSGINCGSDCTELFNSGTVITLTASPSAGSNFTGWSGGGCSGTGNCTLTMSSAQSVTATFTLQQFSLTVTRAGAGTGSVTSSPAGINCGADCNETYNFGTSVTLTATPASGDTFAGWSGAGCTGTGTCTVTMNAATSVTATFNP